MSTPQAPIYLRISGSHLNVNGLDQTAPEETTLQFPDTGSGSTSSEIWLLRSFHYDQTGGSGTTYAPRLGQTSGFTNGDINTRLAYSATAVATATSEVFDPGIPCRTDASGRLYFQPGFDVNTDNDGNYEFYFQKAMGGG